MQSARKTGARIWRRIYGAGFWRQFLERVYEALVLAKPDLTQWRAKNGFVDSLTTAGRASTDIPYVNVNQRKKKVYAKAS